MPVLPTEADLAKAEKRLEQTELRDQQTMRPGLRSRQDRQNVKRTIRRVEESIESGKLGERDLYDAIVNLHLLKHTLKGLEGGHRNAAVLAFENALLVQRIVARYLRL